MTRTLFLTDEEYDRYSNDPVLIAQKADAFIRELYSQVETAKAQCDASSITAEQTCLLLEQRYISLKSEFNMLQSQLTEINSTLEERVSELAQLQEEKQQNRIQSIGKDVEIERLSRETSEIQKSKRKLVELMEHKDVKINEKDASIKCYLDKIVSLSGNASLKESRISELVAELARSHASCVRMSQEKEIVERHNIWLNDELTSKINSLLELRKVHSELEADLSSKLADLERKYNDNFTLLKWKDDRVKELESKLESLQVELCSSKDAASATEEHLSAELSTVNKLLELYKESSQEWSKKAEELEGAIKALETHATQVEKDYKEKLEKETSARLTCEKEVVHLKEKLGKYEEELKSCRNSDQLNLIQTSSYENLMLVPEIPMGISGTALAASLLRDGWNLVKMYEKYQEAIDALRHEQMGRKQSQSILERVLHEVEEKADAIMDERAEHDRMVESFNTLNERLQHSLNEQASLERTIQELKADLRRHERDYTLGQKENNDLQKEVTILLKECRDIQLRSGSVSYHYGVDQLNVNSDADNVIPEQLLTFKDINGLVEQNVQLRSLVRLLTEQIETKEVELKENFEKDLQKHSNEAASKVDAVLARAEEQAAMIESLHASVTMYQKLYEEEHKLHHSYPQSKLTAQEEGRNDVMPLLEDSHDASKREIEQARERVKFLEEEMAVLRGEIYTLRSHCDKITLEANFAKDNLDRCMKEFEHQRDETNGIISRNIELSQLIADYKRKILEAYETSHVADDLSRKLNMEVTVLRREKEILSNAEKKACKEVDSLLERVHRLQATLDTIQSTEEAREEARIAQRKNQDDHVKCTEREWAEARKELLEERENVCKLTDEHDISMKDSMQQIQEMGSELANALRALADANARASVAEARCSDLEKTRQSGIKNSEINDDASLSNDLRVAKEEIEKLREEALVNKDQMLQYKSIAQVNETALKQMEAEAEKVKKSLEHELVSLKEQVKQLQDDCNLRAKEAASASVLQEEALASSLAEIASLREECSAKMLQIEVLESQLSCMKHDLEKEQQRVRIYRDNYERQVRLQSETIQELKKTSQVLASLQEEASELRRESDCLRIENRELSCKWETEKLVLEKAKTEAEQKFDEINEQNKILHSQLEALHIKLAEKDSSSGAQPSRSVDQDSFVDSGFHNVVKYLRRTKEIAETEISFLKQEKLRLQSQLDCALQAEVTAQESLRAERENSRSFHFSEDDFKALQIQVREMNLLRESNMQLREENKHNVEECQKHQLYAQNARNEVENLKGLLAERKNEVDMQKEDRKELEKRVNKLLEMTKNNDFPDCDRMRADIQQMQVKLKEKDGQLEEVKKILSQKQEVLLRLEQDLARIKVQVDERESKIRSFMQAEASLKSDVDQHKRSIAHLKRRCDSLSKERDELTKKTQNLSTLESASEQVTREREEKNTRIQMLERTVDKLRDEVKKGKDEARFEKVKLADDMEKHKQALKNLLNHVEKLKLVTEAEGASGLSEDLFDDLASVCLLAIENYEQVARQVFVEIGVPSTVRTVIPAAAQSTKESGKTLVPAKPKVGRRLVRPRITKHDRPPKGHDADMLEANAETSACKRPTALSTSEEVTLVHENSGDVAAPLLKKPRGLEQPQQDAEDQRNAESLPSFSEESPGNAGDEIQNLKAEAVESGRDGDEDTGEDQGELQEETEFTEEEQRQQRVVHVTGSEPEEGKTVVYAAVSGLEDAGAIDDEATGEGEPVEHLMRSPSPIMPIDDEATGDTLGVMEITSCDDDEGETEVETEDELNNESNDETGAMAEEIATEKIAAPIVNASGAEKTSNTCATAEASGRIEGVSNASTSEPVEVKQEESVADTSSKTINLNERARQRSLQRIYGSLSYPTVSSVRGRTPWGRGRGGRSGRGGRMPGSQGLSETYIFSFFLFVF